jgi:hypothetical protein
MREEFLISILSSLFKVNGPTKDDRKELQDIKESKAKNGN